LGGFRCHSHLRTTYSGQPGSRETMRTRSELQVSYAAYGRRSPRHWRPPPLCPRTRPPRHNPAAAPLQHAAAASRCPRCSAKQRHFAQLCALLTLANSTVQVRTCCRTSCDAAQQAASPSTCRSRSQSSCPRRQRPLLLRHSSHALPVAHLLRISRRQSACP
jgi:hypothetical protein